MVSALLDLAQQCNHASALGMRQLAKSLLLLRRPLPWSTGMTSLVQSGQAKLVPALPPLLDAVQVHPNSSAVFCSVSPWLNRKISCARIRVRACEWNTPTLRSVRRSSSDSSKCFIAQPLLRDQFSFDSKNWGLLRRLM
jgi:hypothetical protein